MGAGDHQMKKTLGFMRFWSWVYLCCSWTIPQPAQAKDIPMIYSAVTASESVVWVAHETGMFQKYGINTQLVYVSAGSRAMNALLAGETPILFSAGSPAVSAALGGARVKIIMGLLNVFPYYVVSAKAISQVEQLRGKRIGISRFGSSGHAAAVYALRRFNLEPGRDVALLQIGGGAVAVRAVLVQMRSFSTSAEYQEPPRERPGMNGLTQARPMKSFQLLSSTVFIAVAPELPFSSDAEAPI